MHCLGARRLGCTELSARARSETSSNRARRILGVYCGPRSFEERHRGPGLAGAALPLPGVVARVFVLEERDIGQVARLMVIVVGALLGTARSLSQAGDGLVDIELAALVDDHLVNKAAAAELVGGHDFLRASEAKRLSILSRAWSTFLGGDC